MQIIGQTNKFVFNQIKLCKCKLKRENKKSEYNFFVRVNDDNKLNFYMFSKKNHKMIKVSAEELEYMLNNVLEITGPETLIIKEELKNRKNVSNKERKVGEIKMKNIMLEDEEREAEKL